MASILPENIDGYLSVGISVTWGNCELQGTDNVQMEAVLFFIFQIFFAAYTVLGNIRSHDVFRPIAFEWR